MSTPPSEPSPEEKPNPEENKAESVSDTAPADATTTKESVAEAQIDGASVPKNGSEIQELEANVEVKLADLQADPNNPLFSAKSFEELNLYVKLTDLRRRSTNDMLSGSQSC